MERDSMANPEVTIVVVPRERFSYTERSLQSIYSHTTFPFRLVYVCAGAPTRIKRFLENESRQKNFQLIGTDHYLSPNQARNLALRHVTSKYVVFIDNDALVTPGWLEALICCAEETEAWVVGPLYLIGALELQTIHMAGGIAHIKKQQGRRILYDEHRLVDTPLAEVRVPLERGPCDYVEFHCMLVRTDVFERLGPLDEGLLSVHEHIDLGLAVRRAGGSVYFEPSAVTTYVPPPPCDWSDLPYFMLRWSEAWNVASVRHFNEKWGVSTVRWFGDQSDLDLEDTIIRWGRGQRRLMTGLRVPADGMAGRPELPLEEAELMVGMFQSVDRDAFDLMLIAEDERVIECATALNPQALMEQLPRVLKESEEKNYNVGIGPRSQGRPNEPALVRVDDIDAEQLKRIRSYAFLILETRPDTYQCWLAIAKNPSLSVTLRRLLEGKEIAGANTAYLAGSKNVNHQQADGSYLRVRLVGAQAGLLNTVWKLEKEGVLPYLWPDDVL
jgi:GT2 family glycosyltransferase